jgi:hypothetical protein
LLDIINASVLALDIRHANRICHAPHYIVFCVLSDGGIFFFPKLSHTGLDFRKTKLFYIERVLSFSLQLFFYLKHFFIQEEFNVCVCLRAKYP